MRFSKTQSALFAALATTVVGTSAQAEGPGLRVGDLAIHPSVFAIGGYDDNVYFAAPQESPLGASLLRIGGGVALENRSPNKISLEGGADVSYRHLFPSGTPENSKAVEARNTLDRAGLNAMVGFLPRAPITTELHENLTFRDNPAYEELEIGFRKLDNIAGVDLRFRPGADADSRPFELRLGYRLETVSYLGDKTSEIGADLAEKTAHNLNFLSQWRFLPKTSLLAEVGWSSVHYDRKLEQPAVTAGGTFETTSADRDSRPVYAVVGVKGLITRRISTNLKVGYKNTFNVSGSSYNGVIATAEGTYAIEPTLRATLGEGRGSLRDLDASVQDGEDAWRGSGAVMGLTLGNHDVPRFASVASGTAEGAGPAPSVDDARAIARQALALGMLYLLPGAPVVQWGDEVALPGRGDPDNRRVLPADEALTVPQKALREAVRALGRLRPCSPALRRGSYRVLSASDELLAFSRHLGEAEIIAVLQRSASMALPNLVAYLPEGAAAQWRLGLRLDYDPSGGVVARGPLALPATAEPDGLTLDSAPLSLRIYVPRGVSCVLP